MAAPALLRNALRSIAGSTRLSLSAVLCIALGTAATSATLTLVSAAFLRSLPFPAAERLLRIWSVEDDGGGRVGISYPDFVDLAAEASTLDVVEATARARLAFRTADGTRRVEGEAVSAGYFELLGVEPAAGRLFTPDEHATGGEAVMLLDHRAWGERFSFAPGAVGSVVATERGPYTIVGVLPPDFAGTVEEDSGELEFWVPLADYLNPERLRRRDIDALWLLARRAPGSSLPAAQAEVAALGRRLDARGPRLPFERRLAAEPFAENWRSQLRGGSLLVLGSSLLLLLVAATNVSVVLLARAVAGRRELAIRAALGARPRRLVAQVVSETLLLVAAGGVLGLIAGPVLLRALLAASSLPIPSYVEPVPGAIAIGLCLGILAVTALLASLGPAVFGSRVAPAGALQEEEHRTAGGRRSRRWAAILVVAEVALTTVLVVATVGLVRTYHGFRTDELGYRTQGVLRIALFADPQDAADERLTGFYQRAQRLVQAEPGVEAVGLVWPTVPILVPVTESLRVPAAPGELGAEGRRVEVFTADRAFFDVMEVPLLAGRHPRQQAGDEGPQEVLVSDSLAREIAGSAAFGQALERPGALGETAVRVVGVVGDARWAGPRQEEVSAGAGQLYLPFARSPQRLASLVVRTGGDADDLVAPLTRRLGAFAPASALDWAGPLDGWLVEMFLLRDRFVLYLVVFFSAAALVLAAVGLSGLLADSVARRRAELAMRQALGASPQRILVSVTLRGLSLALTGLAAGGLLVWLASGLTSALFEGSAAADPWSFLATAAVLSATALAASALPARRAARVHPAIALRGR